MDPQRFEVWAPHAKQVELVLEDHRLPMDAEGGGWFAVEAETAPGDAYRFSLDGTDPLPDPRSAWQPDGPHGASRVVDHSAFK